MKKGIVLYQSKYGATKKYAEWLAGKTGFDCVELKKAEAWQVAENETVVLGGVWSQFGSESAVQMQSALQRQVLGYPEVRAKVLMADVTSRPALVGAAAMGLRHFVDDPMRFVSA